MKRYGGWLRLASHLGKGLWETMNSTTLVEFELWMEWFRQEMDHPSRSDFYLMMIAFHVIRGYARYPGQIKFKDMLLHFDKELEEQEPKVLDDRTVTALMQAKWVGTMTKPVRIVKPGEPHPE